MILPVFFSCLLLGCGSCTKKTAEDPPPEKKAAFTAMVFNLWHEGTQVPNGFKGILDEISHYQPDFAALIEIRNSDGVDFLKKLRDSLAAKDLKYYSTRNNQIGILSKHPILSYANLHSMHKIIAKINAVEIAFYAAHLDYRYYAEYLPRGYDGDGNKLPDPVTDVQKILEEDARSTRPEAIAAFISDVNSEKAKKRCIILAGDFNEASHLDWTEKTKNLYAHNGVVISWPSSAALYNNGFKDSYRAVYPDETRYPGFTWVVANPWLPDTDERDRIDFIYYYDDKKLKPVSSNVIGPEKIYIGSQLLQDDSEDQILLPQSVWPSDHRAVTTKFIYE